MADPRVFVTGAAGRVGANMVRRLAAEGYQVVAMVLPADPPADAAVRITGPTRRPGAST